MINYITLITYFAILPFENKEAITHFVMQVELVIVPRSIITESPPEQQNQPPPPPPPPQNQDSSEEQNEEEEQEVELNQLSSYFFFFFFFKDELFLKVIDFGPSTGEYYICHVALRFPLF